MGSQKYIFLQALIITLVVFNLGIYFGYKLESYRINKIDRMYFESEMLLLDQRLQGDSFDVANLNCDKVFQENVNFADKIFEEASIIGEYEKASRINQDIILQHKRFDLLRTLFWVNSIKIKNYCNLSYHNVVYIYRYNEPTFDQSSKQAVFSNLLLELKEEKGSEIMLIPIAGDGNLSSIDILLDSYGVKEFPSILIDEKIILTEIRNREDIEKHLS